MSEIIQEKFRVLLFYKYIKLNPQIKIEEQRKICLGTNIKGRVLIGEEGINGTVGGSFDEIEHYLTEIRKDPDFADIDFKESESDIPPFPKLKIKYRKEVVTLGLKDDIDMQSSPRGKYIKPDEVQELIEKGEEVYFVDARNNYESKIGKFKDAFIPDIENFRDFPEYLTGLEHLKKKKVIFYCTGGIRCEKATALAVREGFEDVYHIEGGIQRYAEKYPKGNFEGKMYVFDDRIGVAFDESEDRTILTSCEFCNKPCDDYKNCFNSKCNKRIIACDACFKENEGCCSQECKEIKHPRKVEYRFKEKL